MSYSTVNLQQVPIDQYYTRGYTLIELLITITITAVLVTIGVTAYGRAAETQAIKSDTEKIIEVLTSAQKAATSGRADCVNTSGPYLGERVTTSTGSNSITVGSICQNGNGEESSIELASTIFMTTNSLIFRPLNQGVDTGATSVQYLDLAIGNNIYRIQVERSGSIKASGKITQ